MNALFFFWKKYKSFTLIEMLIVIVIIGILAAALVPRLQSVQNRARDTKRKADLQQISNALYVYNADNNYFPYWASDGWNCASYQPPTYMTCVVNSLSINWLTDLTSSYISDVPIDPTNTSVGNYTIHGSVRFYTGYMYGYQSVNGRRWFSLTTRLENAKDPDRCGVKLYNFYNGGGVRTSCAWSRRDIYVVNGGVLQ